MTRSQMGCAAFAAPPELPREAGCAIWQEGKLCLGNLWQTGNQLCARSYLLPTFPHLPLDCFCFNATCGFVHFPGGRIHRHQILKRADDLKNKTNKQKTQKPKPLSRFLLTESIKAETQSWTSFPSPMIKVRENAAQGNNQMRFIKMLDSQITHGLKDL